MLKSELIQLLNEIPGDPVILKKVRGKWRDVVAVIATGEHRNGITMSTSGHAWTRIDYLGPVP